MKPLMTMTYTQTMTSKEIAELTGREHDSVLRSVRNIYYTLPADLRSGIESTTYTDSNGKSQPMFNLDKDSVLCLISGYDIIGRMRIIKRWQELEQLQQQTLPQTHIEAVEAYLVTLKTVEAQEKQLGIQQKVIAHKNVKTDSSDTHFTIKRIRSLNQGMKIDPKILSKVAKDLDSEIETVYDHYGQSINQYARSVWEEAYPDASLP